MSSRDLLQEDESLIHNANAVEILSKLTRHQKIRLVSGASMWTLKGIPSLGLPSIWVSDGPHGLRKQHDKWVTDLLSGRELATCFPTASCLACSWDRSLLERVGKALALECRANSVSILLGPGINIIRHPCGGRNFEYFSEDPILTGNLAAAYVNGVQSQGIGVSLKHFLCNNQETWRLVLDVIIDERTQRELYEVAFEYVIKACQPWTVMCGYNKVNGVFGSENPIFKRLRNEWKFQGLVMTDWGATNDRVEGLRAGVDLEMPGSVGACDDFIEIALSNGELTLQQLDKCVLRVLRLMLTCKEQLEQESVILDNEIKTILEHHHILARKAATQSIVLLKNEQNLLPLQRDVSLAVIGAFAKIPRFQGMGSSEVNAFKIDNAWERIQEYTVNARYAPGYVRLHPVGGHQELIDEAVKLAANADVAIIFCGLNEISESEAFDKSDCNLSAGHDELIEAVTQVNSNTIVVLSNGSAVLMPWERRVKSIMESWLGGQAGASATVDLLFGTSSPSGKLAQTFAERTEDIPSSKWFPGSNRQVQYREGLNVGYRYFNSSDREALYPFGHGLTYSKFEFTNLNVQILNSSSNERQVFVSVEVENVGSVEAAEVIQCYVHDVESSVYRPYHELKGFEKVFLQPNHKENVTLILDHRAFSFWDIGSKQWILEAGSFEVQVGSSSKDIRLRTTIYLESSQVASDESKRAYPSVDHPLTRVYDSDEEFKVIYGKDIPQAQASTILHYNSIIGDTQHTILGRTLKSSGLKAMLKNFRDPPEHQVKFSEEILNNTPLRGLALFSRGALSFALLDVLIHIMNGELRQALIKVPAALGSIVFGNMFVNSDKA